MRVLLLPGLDGTGRLFGPLIAALPAPLRAEVVAYPSQEPRGYAELLPMVEEAAARGPCVVVGESFSGPLALMLATREPRAVRGVVLCASFVRPPGWSGTWIARAAAPWMFRSVPSKVVSWALLGKHGRGPIGQALVTAVRSVSPAVLAARVRAIASVDATTNLQNCPTPVVYLQAAHDRIVGAGSLALIRALRPDIQAVTLPGPHLLLQACPLPCAGVIADFSQRVANSTGPSPFNEESRP